MIDQLIFGEDKSVSLHDVNNKETLIQQNNFFDVQVTVHCEEPL